MWRWLSVQICEAVRETGQVVWAHTRADDGLLGRSDLPLRTAVGAPICSIGFDLCILIMFSPGKRHPGTPSSCEQIYVLPVNPFDACADSRVNVTAVDVLT
jgi:hypothetical protein